MAEVSPAAQEVLCIGPEGSGKTLLLKSLQFTNSDKNQAKWSFQDIPTHAPTVGSDLTTLNLSKMENKSRKKNTTSIYKIRELGGQMGPIWKTYFKNTEAVMFVIDSGNPFQIAPSIVLLHDCLTHEDLKEKPFLVIFSKTDIQGPIGLQEFQNIMMYDLFIEEDGVGRSVTTVSCSAVSGSGIKTVFEWLSNLRIQA